MSHKFVELTGDGWGECRGKIFIAEQDIIVQGILSGCRIEEEGPYAAVDILKRNKKRDAVNHPSHYTSDPSGVECITITRHRNFNIGNAIKYLWRAGLKKDPSQDDLAKQIEDLRKAVFYIEDEIKRLEEENKN